MKFSLPWDALPAERLRDFLLTWVATREEPAFAEAELGEYYQTVLPRSVFVKSLERGARVLDLGAGNGSLTIYKKWPRIARPDLLLYALSLEVGEFFSAYEAFDIGNFEERGDLLPGIGFDAVICAHFIEHMEEPARTFEFCSERLAQGGRLYLEWPHPMSLKMPSCNEFTGICVTPFTTHFFDDRTHKQAWDADHLCDLLEQHGFGIEGYGRVYFPYLADQLKNAAIVSADKVNMTQAIWCRVGWAQHLTAVKL